MGKAEEVRKGSVNVHRKNYIEKGLSTSKM